MSDALVFWLRAFAFTQLVEAPIYRRMLRVGWARAIAPTTLTHPVVWFVFPLVGQGYLGLGYVPTVLVAEPFAWGVEAAFFVVTKPRVALRRALAASLVANTASLLLGLASRWAFGMP